MDELNDVLPLRHSGFTPEDLREPYKKRCRVYPPDLLTFENHTNRLFTLSPLVMYSSFLVNFAVLFLPLSLAIPITTSDDTTLSNGQARTECSFSSTLTSDSRFKASNISSSCLPSTIASPTLYPIRRIKTWSLHGIPPTLDGVGHSVQVDHLTLTPNHHYTLNYALHPRTWFTAIVFMDSQDGCRWWLSRSKFFLLKDDPVNLKGGFSFKLPERLTQPMRICLVDTNLHWGSGYQPGDKGIMTLWDVSPR